MTSEPAAAPGGARWPALLALVLGALLIASVAVAYVYGDRWREAKSLDRARADAEQSAQQFALRMDNFDGANLAAYTKGIDDLLTTKAKADFKQQFEAFGEAYAAAKAKGEGKILISGVGDADADSATVLVVHDAQVSSTQGTQQRHFRWSVSMVKVKGQWRVDDFTPVN